MKITGFVDVKISSIVLCEEPYIYLLEHQYMASNTRQNLIINLKVISKLQPHVKLDTSSALFKINQSPQFCPEYVWRWWMVHNRKQDLARISLLFEESLKEKGDEQVVKALREATQGLNSLKTTYEEDATIVAMIEYIIENLNRELA